MVLRLTCAGAGRTAAQRGSGVLRWDSVYTLSHRPAAQLVVGYYGGTACTVVYSVYSGVQWCTVVYSGVQWCTVVYSGVPPSRHPQIGHLRVSEPSRHPQIGHLGCLSRSDTPDRASGVSERLICPIWGCLRG